MSESESSKKPSKRFTQNTPSSSQRKGGRPVLEGETTYIGVGVNGNPIGEYAARAKYTDHEIGFVFQLREEGYTYRQIAKIMDMPRSTCFAICHGLMRSTVIYNWKRRGK